MDIFEKASRRKFRFASVKGDLTSEQLWDLPLTSKSGADLDTIARAINADLKSVTEESFVALNPDPRRGDLDVKLDVVKHVIAVRIAEAEKAKVAAANAAKRAKLLEALASKEDEAFASKTSEELLAELAAIDAA